MKKILLAAMLMVSMSVQAANWQFLEYMYDDNEKPMATFSYDYPSKRVDNIAYVTTMWYRDKPFTNGDHSLVTDVVVDCERKMYKNVRTREYRTADTTAVPTYDETRNDASWMKESSPYDYTLVTHACYVPLQ
jgi:hypothetical protein